MINEYPQIAYAQNEGLIFPYIVSFIDERQDQLILWPSELIHNHNDFIKMLNRNSNNDQVLQFFARAFSYQDNYLNIYITYPTDAKEKGSWRSGLYLTLGVLIHKKAFDSFIPCKNFMKYYLYRFQKIFNIDLNKNGATDFTEALENHENYPNISEKIEELLSELFLSLFQTEKSKRINFSGKVNSLFNRGKDKFPFPSIIICSEDKNGHDSIMNFFSVIDEYIQRRRSIKRLDFTTASGRIDKSVTIIPCLPDNIRLDIEDSHRTVIALKDSHGRLIIFNSN